MKITLEQHITLGEQVRQFREALLQPHVICCGTKSSKQNRSVRNLIKSLDRLKNEMDNVACNDFPSCEFAHQIYYGMSKKWIKDHARK